MRRLPPTSPEVQDYEHKCFASVHCLSVHAAMVFVLYVMTGSLMSPWGESVIQRAQIFLVLQTKNKVCIIFYFIHEPVRKHWCNLNRFTDKWMALHHENVLMHKLVKRLRFENDEKTFLPFWYFYYFIFMRTLFLPFRFASLPQFSLFTALSLGFSWKRSAQEFYDCVTECWDTKHFSSTGEDGGTGLTNRDTKPHRPEENVCV